MLWSFKRQAYKFKFLFHEKRNLKSESSIPVKMACYTSLLSLFPIASVIFFASLSSSSSSSRATHSGSFSKIYAFGDSFTDTGNTGSSTGPSFYGQVSRLPYGITFFHHPTNRYSDGRLVVDFLATDLSLPFLPPYLNRTADFTHGVNFAVAGSTAVDHDYYVKNNVTFDITPQSLQTQLVWFNNFLQDKGCHGSSKSGECRMAMKDALFWVGEIGVNDYAYTYASSLPTTTVQALAVNTLTNFLQALLKMGAKYIVVQGLPMIGCLPLTLYLTTGGDRDALGCSASANKLIQTHNSLLQAKLQDLRRQYPQAFISYADYERAHRTVMTNSSRYGLREKFMTCCGSGGPPYNYDLFATCGSPKALKACTDPTMYVNWDGVHLTEAVYKTVADLILHHGYCIPSFDQLLKSKGQER